MKINIFIKCLYSTTERTGTPSFCWHLSEIANAKTYFLQGVVHQPLYIAKQSAIRENHATNVGCLLLRHKQFICVIINKQSF